MAAKIRRDDEVIVLTGKDKGKRGKVKNVLSSGKVIVEGINKEKVGAVASKIRAIRPVEPYHGYGIRYTDEKVSLKEGKSSGKGGKK